MASLPPALLARLKKRGIVKSDGAIFQQQKRRLGGSLGAVAAPGEGEEEVFAESYDHSGRTRADETATVAGMGSATDYLPDEHNLGRMDNSGKYRGGAPGCPNRNNPYHLCTEFCFDHWQEGYPESRLSDRYLEQRKNMLRDYPLPPGWKEVYDAGMHRYYYWNTNTDEVCWVSPRHPKAVISEAAPKLARELLGELTASAGTATTAASLVDKVGAVGNRRSTNDGTASTNCRLDSCTVRRFDREQQIRRRAASVEDREDSDGDGSSSARNNRIELSDRDRLKRAKRRGLDPMDPAAYADVEPGKWSSGLISEAKTGADVTAAGPLFQQRPYPAPGAVLRKNNPQQPGSAK